MKSQINKMRKILPATTAIIFLLGVFNSTFAQKGIGAKYGARDPRVCGDASAPKTGAISAAQAAQYVTCAAEKESTYLYLAENVAVRQVAERRYNMNEDINVPNIDVRANVDYRTALSTRKMERLFDCFTSKTGGIQCTTIGDSEGLSTKDKGEYLQKP